MPAAAQRTYKILRFRKASEKIGLGLSTKYDLMNAKSPRFDPTFPLPVKLTKGGSVGLIESELDTWIEARIAASCRNASPCVTAKDLPTAKAPTQSSSSQRGIGR